MSTTPVPEPSAYPLPRPEDDPRFTFGLMLDVAKVLAAHGYPEITSGADLMELQRALFSFTYDTATDDQPAEPARPANPEPESALREVDPDSIESRVAAQLSGQLSGHISSWSISRYSGGLICGIPGAYADERVGHLRYVHALLPDATVDVREDDDWLFLDLNIVRDGIPARIGICVGTGPVWAELQAEVRTWLAEVGTEVSR